MQQTDGWICPIAPYRPNSRHRVSLSPECPDAIERAAEVAHGYCTDLPPGKRLARARKLRELTQEDLAHLSDVSLSTLRALEAGADGVALGNFLKVLQGLHLLDQVEDWLDPRRDPETVNFVERRLGGG